MGIEIVTKMMLLPDGMEADDYNAHTFAIYVEYKGPRSATGRGGYAVTDGYNQLSRAGKWGNPQPFQQHQYRWETIEEALEWARKIENRRVGGFTWAELQARKAMT